MQQPADLERLKERYRFDEWKDAGDLGGGPPRSVAFTGGELPGWRLVRQTRREPEGHPALVRTMWQGETSDALLGIDLHECDSPAEAREYLLRRLGEAQGPVMTRWDALGAGDVAFVTPGETMVAFARGGTVAVLHAAGRRAGPLGEAARAVDALLRVQR